MRIINQGLIFNAQQATETQRVAHFTGLHRLASGTILATFRRGRGKDSADGNCAVAQSADNGATWNIIADAFDHIHNDIVGEIRELDLCETTDGNLLAFLTWIDHSSGKKLYDDETGSLLPSKLLLAKSSDAGATWTTPQELSTGPLTGAVLTGPTVSIPARGHLGFFENFQHEQPGGPSLHSAHALFSPDGAAFDTVVNVARHPQDKLIYWDQRHAYCPQTNRLIGMFWTYDRAAEHDVDIHIATGDPATLTWQTPRATGIKGQITAPIPLPDGRLLAFYVHRHQPGSMRLILSQDQGATWDHDNELIIYDTIAAQEHGMDGNSDFAQYWDDIATWCFGHPAGIVLEDQTVLLTYYGGPNDKCLNVHWTRVQL